MRVLLPLVFVTSLAVSLTAGVNQAPQAPSPFPGGAPGQPAPGPFGPPRDVVREPEGTAQVSGRIYAGQANSPLRRAQVVLANQGNRRRVTTTDAEGRYAFDRLPAGRYTLSATKDGYVPLQFGQRLGREVGTPLTLTEGQRVDSADITLPRGTVIVARITDEYGEPFPGVRVQLQRFIYGPDGQRQTVGVAVGNPFNESATSDRGEVRLFGLMPGDYLVLGTVRNTVTSSTTNVTDTSQGYPVTYYPGTMNPQEAAAVTVGVSEEQTIQFAMTAGRLARLSGRVMDMSGNPVVSGRVSLISPTGVNASLGMTAADGTFSAAGIAPGQYTLRVVPSPPATASGAAVLPITVIGEDLSGLQLVMGANATLSGTVVRDGAPGIGPTLRVVALRADGSMFDTSTPSDPTSSGDALGGSFRLVTVPGRVLLSVTGSSGWVVRSITAGGKDLLDTPLELESGATLSDIRVVVTDKVSTVSGRATDEAGRPQTTYAVVMLSADARDPAVVSRLSRYVRPGTDGVFEVHGLRPGRYVAAAFDALESGRQHAPAVQDRIRQRGRTFTVEEGQTITLDLPMMTGLN